LAIPYFFLSLRDGGGKRKLCTQKYAICVGRASVMETLKVGMREFRADLADYIASSTPVAITRHGQTVGYFIPTRGQGEADLAALKKASETLDKLLAAHSVDIETIVTEFKTARRQAKKPKALGE
jgi:hypothetical protein